MEGAELKDYLDRNYGTCKLTVCLCRSHHKPRFGGEWVGTMCPDWVPTGAATWDELKAYIMENVHDRDLHQRVRDGILITQRP